MNLTKHESEILVLKCFSLRCILSNSWQGMKHNYSCIIYIFTLFFRYDIITEKLEAAVENGESPWPRYAHSSVYYDVSSECSGIG